MVSALTLLLAEGAVRLVAKMTDNVRGAVFDPELGWRLVPGITKRDAQWADSLPATTNSLGWRDAEFAEEKVSGRVRIVTLGDSFTFGFGVDYGDRFSEILERRNPGAEVLNMGVFAYGPDQELLAYERDGRHLDPDVVALNLYLGNDLQDIRSKVIHSFPKPYFTLRGDSLALVPPEPDWWVISRSRSYLAELAFRVTAGRELRTEAAPELTEGDEVDLLLAILKRLADTAEADGAKLLLVLIHPRDASTDERERHERLASDITRLGREVLDLRRTFEDASSRGEELYLADGHWNREGHALFAESLEADLVDLGWLSHGN